MFRVCRILSLIVVSSFGIALAGCSKEPAPVPATPAPPEPVPADAVESSPSDVTAAFAGLSEADRVAALAQKVCPVSGDELGGMGTPIKVSVNGRDVFICCESCKEPLLADPDKYLAKLDAK
jgi:YHS domain-containing protein